MNIINQQSIRLPLTASHFMLKRGFHTSPKCYKNYALLVGGGVSGRNITRIYREHLPELAEYNDISNMHSSMKKSHLFSDIRVLFAEGEKTKKAIRWPGTIMSLMMNIFPLLNPRAVKFFMRSTSIEQIKEKQDEGNYSSIQPLDDLKGEATLIQFKSEMDHLSHSLKSGDRLWIYITGHGIMFRGVVLWNEFRTKDYINPNFISEQLDKLPKGVSTTLVIDSCYSGAFLSLSSPTVTVLSSSNSTRPSPIR